MKKRYEPKHPYHDIYNDYLCKFLRDSVILNTGREEIANENTVILDTPNTKLELLRRIGNQFGLYQRGGGELVADIPYNKSKLNEVEERWKAWKRQKLNEGKDEPTEYPKHLLEAKLKLEAKLDTLEREVEVLTKKLTEIREADESKTDGEVLEYGLLGNGKFWGSQAPTLDLMNVLRFIDGQKISQTKDGLLIINDERSIYSGMSVANYRNLCNIWRDTQKKKAREKLKVLQVKAREEGGLIPSHLAARAPFKISKNSLPDWPEGVRNYLEEPEESSTIMKRTKK